MVDEKPSRAREMVEDYALAKPPTSYKSTFMAHFSMLSIPFCLYYLAVGSLSVAFAGLYLGMLASLIAFVLFIFITWVFGYLSWKHGYSYDVISRLFGWGHKGSFFPSLISVWLFITFWAMETYWMAAGIKVMYDINIWWYYILLLPLFILVPIFGHRALAYWNYGALPLAVVATVYLLINFYVVGPNTIGQTFEMVKEPLIPVGFGGALDWSFFALGLWAVTAGDFGRFIHTKGAATYGIGLFQGALCHIVMPIVGILLIVPMMFLLTPQFGEAAGAIAFEMSLPYAYVLGWFGVFVVLTWQLNVQYINAYLPSLNLSNFFYVMFNWNPGRWLWVIVINLLGIAFLASGLLEHVETLAGYAAAALLLVVVITLADYFYRLSQGISVEYNPEEIRDYNPVAFIVYAITMILSVIIWRYTVVPTISAAAIPLGFVLYFIFSYVTKGKYQLPKSIQSNNVKF